MRKLISFLLVLLIFASCAEKVTQTGKASFYSNKFNSQIVPRPDHWGGYIVKPTAIEFWQGRSSRLHDRLRYSAKPEGWTLERLAP